MRRFYSSTILAASVAVVAALAPGVDALAVGSPPGGFVIPIGSTASFTNVLFGACNNLSWGKGEEACGLNSVHENGARQRHRAPF